MLGDLKLLKNRIEHTGNKADEQHQLAVADGTEKSVKPSAAGSKPRQKLMEAGVDVARLMRA